VLRVCHDGTVELLRHLKEGTVDVRVKRSRSKARTMLDAAAARQARFGECRLMPALLPRGERESARVTPRF
jgi:hypothetical protein